MHVWCVLWETYYKTASLLRPPTTHSALLRENESHDQTVQASGDAVPTPEALTGIDTDKVKGQTRAMLAMVAITGFLFGLWIIWSPLLPALGIANEFCPVGTPTLG